MTHHKQLLNKFNVTLLYYLAFNGAGDRPRHNLSLEEREHDEGRKRDDDSIGEKQIILRIELADLAE